MKTNRIYRHIFLFFNLFFWSFELFAQIDTLPPYPVRNLINPTVNAKVFVGPEGYTYSYLLSNGINALQNIYSFMVYIKASFKGGSSPTNWYQSNINYDTIKVTSWNSEDTTTDIRPNMAVNGFEIRSLGIPMIGRYWAAAWEEIPSEEGQYDPTSFGIFTTHLCRTTISPADPFNPFVPINFLDTLTSYTTQSRTLGWIKDQPTVNKYLGYFTSAKTSLQQNNVASIRTTLQQVLQDVNVDSTSNLTSEAYALIRYNTEYLLAQLPQQVIVPVPELIDSLRSKLQQCYANKQIGDRRFVQELDDHLKDAKREYLKGDSIGCAQELEEFYMNIRQEYLAKPKRHDRRFVEEEAYQLLYPLAKEIESRVLTLPPRTTGTVLEQITALRAQIRLDAQKGYIGGEILFRNLESILDRANRELQRQDSLGAALHVRLFRQTVRQTYELTKKLPKSKLYVKLEGYISLYYRAGYILEQLPETNKFGSSMPKLEPELEKELKEYEKEVDKPISR